MIGPFIGISSRAACVPNDECGGPFIVHANVQPLPMAGFPHGGYARSTNVTPTHVILLFRFHCAHRSMHEKKFGARVPYSGVLHQSTAHNISNLDPVPEI